MENIKIVKGYFLNSLFVIVFLVIFKEINTLCLSYCFFVITVFTVSH